MKYKILLTSEALKNYQKINNPFHENIAKKIDELQKKGLDMTNIKALSGEFKSYYRLRVGNYRIIFHFKNDTITIISILHRKEAYN